MMARLARFAGYAVYTVGVFLGTILAAELLVRGLTDVGRLGTERDLFLREGDHFRNAPDVSSVAFGVRVYTDANGFRVAGQREGAQQPGSRMLLVLGDSVGFGVGVEHDRIATTLVDNALEDLDVENASVIGYSTLDYERVVAEQLARGAGRYAGIALIYCLNDVSEFNARNIRGRRAASRAYFPARLVDDNAVTSLRENATVKRVNDLLRAYSSAYVMLRGELTEPRLRHWRGLLQSYEALSADKLEGALAPITRIAARARELDLPFQVWIAPYAWQMADPEALPQTLLGRHFAAHGIEYVDLLDRFRTAERPGELFLPYDPVHLSPRGHQMLADSMLEMLSPGQ